MRKCFGFLAKQSEAKAQAGTNTGTGTTQEFAGKASIRSFSSIDSLASQADFYWNADTGATSHMTPHKHWIRNYKPVRIPIRLADSTIIYSSGIGNILFKPFINGVES